MFENPYAVHKILLYHKVGARPKSDGPQYYKVRVFSINLPPNAITSGTIFQKKK
jgi:hypothetical protein